jgi:hypothetical protein
MDLVPNLDLALDLETTKGTVAPPDWNDHPSCGIT